MSIYLLGDQPVRAVRRSPSSTFVRLVALVAGLTALSSCGDPARSRATDAPPGVVVSPSSSAVSATSVTGTGNPPPVPATLASTVELLTLVDVARSRHPTAQAIDAARRAAEARASQAGVWANPEIELSYGRTRPRISDLDIDRPYGARVAQRVEWWSKRSARVAVATAQVAVAQADGAAALLDLEVEVRLAAIALASAQLTAEQTRVHAELAEELAAVVAKRQALGDIDRGEAARIRLEATMARLRHDAAVRSAANALTILRTWCGDGVPEQVFIRDALVDPTTDTKGALGVPAGAHPRVRAAIEAEYAAQAQVDAERQARIPDVTLGFFGGREWERDTVGVTLGFEVPLWDHHAGRIAEADAERARRSAERASATIELERERAMALADWKATAFEVTALRDQAMPVAEEALRLRTTAFQGGDASLSDVLEARRATLAVHNDLHAARRRHAEAQVRLLAASGIATGNGGQP